MPPLAHQHARLLAEMERQELWPERSPWVRQALEALPRHDFAPDRLWLWDGYHYVPLERERDEQRWAEEVYGSPYDAAVTQVTAGVASSSLSCCAVVVDMLDSLLLEPGHRVLELGTATGWNAALLARRAGPDRVVSVELEAELAATARKTLAAAGAQVRVETADGAAGWPPAAPYDRLIATYAVERVPRAWIEQVRPGGRIVTPWGRLGHVALTVTADGASAQGWIQGLATFMPSRHAPPPVAFEQARRDSPPQHERSLTWDAQPLVANAHLLFALRVALPDVRIATAGAGEVHIHDETGSWAVIETPGQHTTLARQGGPRRLVDEVETAWAEWITHGSPDLYDYGLVVADAGREQFAFAWDPQTGPRWSLR